MGAGPARRGGGGGGGPLHRERERPRVVPRPAAFEHRRTPGGGSIRRPRPAHAPRGGACRGRCGPRDRSALLVEPAQRRAVRREHPRRAVRPRPGGRRRLPRERGGVRGAAARAGPVDSGRGRPGAARAEAARHQPREPRVLRGSLRLPDRRHRDTERQHGVVTERPAARRAGGPPARDRGARALRRGRRRRARGPADSRGGRRHARHRPQDRTRSPMRRARHRATSP